MTRRVAKQTVGLLLRTTKMVTQVKKERGERERCLDTSRSHPISFQIQCKWCWTLLLLLSLDKLLIVWFRRWWRRNSHNFQQDVLLPSVGWNESEIMSQMTSKANKPTSHIPMKWWYPSKRWLSYLPPQHQKTINIMAWATMKRCNNYLARFGILVGV